MATSRKRLANIVLLGVVVGLPVVLLSRYGTRKPLELVKEASVDTIAAVRSNLPFTHTARALGEWRAHRAQWKSLNLQSYVYLFEAHCYCSNGGRHLVTVDDGRIVSVVDAETGESIGIANYRLFDTIDDRFMVIRDALRHGADEYDVTYDPATGIPVRTVYDYREELVDDEGWNTITLLDSSGASETVPPPHNNALKLPVRPVTVPCVRTARARSARRLRRR